MKSSGDGSARPIAEHEPSGGHGLGIPQTGREPSHPDPVATEAPPTNGAISANGHEKEQTPGTSEVAKLPLPRTVSGPLVSDLAEIRAVALCCGECHTVVSLPRIRWANSPENCPNCGARWMRKPPSDGLLPEDDSTYIYNVVSNFRQALQNLIGVKQAAAFDVLLEIGESPYRRKCSPESRRNGRSHA